MQLDEEMIALQLPLPQEVWFRRRMAAIETMSRIRITNVSGAPYVSIAAGDGSPTPVAARVIKGASASATIGATRRHLRLVK
jgi:hypothetical protein